MATEVINVEYSNDPPRHAYSEAVRIIEDMDKRQKESEKGIKTDLTVYEIRELIGTVKATELSHNEIRGDLLRAEKALDLTRKECKVWRDRAILTGVFIVVQFVLYSTGIIPPLFKVLGWV